MKHPSTRALHTYWDRLRGTRMAPDRTEIDPAQIGRLLGDVFLLENGGEVRHAVRLAGTRLCALLGQEIRGRGFAELFAADDRATLFGMFEGVVEDVVPAIAGLVGETASGRTLDLELIALSLRHRGQVHARMLGSLVPLDVPYWTGTEPLTVLRIKTLRVLHADETEGVQFAHASRSLLGRLRLVQGGRS